MVQESIFFLHSIEHIERLITSFLTKLWQIGVSVPSASDPKFSSVWGPGNVFLHPYLIQWAVQEARQPAKGAHFTKISGSILDEQGDPFRFSVFRFSTFWLSVEDLYILTSLWLIRLARAAWRCIVMGSCWVDMAWIVFSRVGTLKVPAPHLYTSFQYGTWSRAAASAKHTSKCRTKYDTVGQLSWS